MKVAINKCYGGFGISSVAIIKLIEMGSPILSQSSMEDWGLKETELTANGKYSVHKFFDIAVLGGVVYSHDRDADRSHVDLISVIENLGEEANAPHAQIVIIDIPDEVEFNIEEYDGMEWIAEKHRTWG